MCSIAREAGVEVIQIAPSLYLICDEPSPWAPLEEWKEHLRKVRELPDPYSPSVKRAVALALHSIREIEAREAEKP